MGTFFHRLKANKTGEFPRNWCFVDTETKEVKINAKTKKQVLRLGTATYIRDKTKGKRRIREVWSFKSAEAFWSSIISACETDRRLVILAYNIGFDCRILDMFRCLPSLGYEIVNVFDKGQVFIASWKRGKHKIIILDAMNYFTGKLADWGKMLGIPKGEVDFKTATDAELLKYCYRDVEILERIWLLWREFVRVHDFGCFSPTKSSQALAGFRHRFMDVPIFIHANPQAIRIERESYYGGRTECFRLGEMPNPPFYKVDINSQYPYVMSKTAVPIKLRRVVRSCRLSQLKRAVKRYGVIASVTLKTDIPAYPFRRIDGLIYPVGTFDVTLAGPELSFALKRKHVKRVHAVALYDVGIIFRRYVRELYGLRMEYKLNGNRVFEQMVKYLLNCLYGKFAQRNEKWKRLDRETTADDGKYYYPGKTLCDGETYRVIAGRIFQFMGVSDSMHSFHAISSYITSAARMYLWSLIELAGRDNVFYTDTDSLIVNQPGFDNLQSVINPTQLGMLKLEYATTLLRLHAPKDYQTGVELHIKGVSKQYHRKSKNKYTGWQWEGIRGAIRNGTMDCVMMFQRDKVLRRDCRKGIVHSSGSISPFRLDGDTSFSRCSIRRS